MTNNEFLNWIADRLVHVYGESPNVDFVHKLRALAEPEQEPVAWELGAEVYWGDSPELSDYVRKEGTPLYTTPPQRTWVGLDDDEVREIYGIDLDYKDGDYARYARAIEAKLKEKNT